VSRGGRVIVKESSSRRIIEQSRLRLLCVGFFFVLCFSSISWRMIEVAVLTNTRAATITVSDTESASNEQVEIKSTDPVFQRGNITDRNGVLLATSLMTASVFANPKEIKEPAETAQRLEKALGGDRARWLSKLSSDKSFVWLKRNLTPKEQQAVNSLGIPGLYFLPEEKRVYPYGNLLSHTVGYVGVDNKGLAGAEKSFDSRLRDSSRADEALKLSIDVRLQAVMHEEVRQAMEAYRAIGAAGVIMDIKTGELLSMVSLPDFDPQKPSRGEDAAKFNRVSLGSYEMGSTFKTFTAAMALEAGTVKMNGGYDATNPFKLASFTINDAHGKKRWLSVPEIYAYSSNIGTAKMALDVGGKKQKAFLEKLGMMKPVEIELPEKAPTQYPSDWKEINTVTISYGHGISVSPLHLVRGIASMVGGGTLTRLTLLKGGNEGRPQGERIISEETSKNVRRLMRLVVDHGTGSKGDVPGYRVGGKTGTAEKVQSGGKYNDDAKLASFIATFPVDDPKYVVLVMVDEPKGDKTTFGYATGGWIAAPVVSRVISRMGPILGIAPRFDVAEDDADKFWFSPDKKEAKQPVHVATTADRRFIHAVAY